MIPILSAPIRDWYCPNCTLRQRTREAKPHVRMHICPGTHYLTVGMLEVGTAGKVEAKLREDYVGDELVQMGPEDGKPYMNVTTTRDEGQDVVVFAPTARFGS
jgi:rubredoxin